MASTTIFLELSHAAGADKRLDLKRLLLSFSLWLIVPHGVHLVQIINPQPVVMIKYNHFTTCVGVSPPDIQGHLLTWESRGE